MSQSPSQSLPFSMTPFLPGWVWLAGAGPGDPALLTLGAWHALGQADVIVYDALVDDSILDLARPGAEKVYAGKRGGRPSLRQPDISRRLVELAQAGHRVLRLKGGDPFVFGRGGEECSALVEAGIPFRIIPGVTAGVGGPAYAGIPVTHRDVNQAVTFLTGHDSTGALSGHIEWEAVARGAPVLVFYMGLTHIGEIANHLMAAGLPPTRPVAVIAEATTPRQTILETSLAKCAEAVALARPATPALIVVGEVVRYRAALDWLPAVRALGRE